jgi:O-antigen/teichoic acid export membrane protein
MLGARFRTARWVGAGLADQIVIAVANAGTTLLGVLLVHPRERADDLLLAIAIGYAAIGLGRAFVGEVLLAVAAREGEERRRELVRHGLTAALAIGAGAGLLLVGIWAVWPRGGRIDLRDLVYLAVFLPVLLMHDAARYTYLAERRPSSALVINVAYAGTQFLIIGGLAVTGLVGGPTLIIAWGLGACAGVALFCLRTKHVPWAGRPRVWFRQTRFLSGWFTATAVIAQAHGLATNFLMAGRLTPGALAGFKLAQTTMLQPVQNVNQALISLLVPRMSRLSGAAVVPAQRTSTENAAASEDPSAAGVVTDPSATLRRQVFRMSVAFSGLAVLMVAVGAPLGSFLLSHVDRFADVAPLALPVLLQGAVYLVQAPFTAALRGMHRAKAHLVQYAIYAGASVVGLIVGAETGGLTGAAWGLAAGAAVGLVASVVLYAAALRHLGDADAEKWVTESEPATELV